jgi:hypothetical protein
MATRYQHFDSIEDVLAHLRADLPPPNHYFPRWTAEYIWATDGPGVRLVPPLSHPYLYRGQTARNCNLPCLPGVFRGLPLIDDPRKLTILEQARCLFRRIQLEEFICALDAHPASVFARQNSLVTYPVALAQHYEMLTDRMDLSQDMRVAAFFATNSRGADGVWYPQEKDTGVLYRLPIPANALDSLRSNFEWIGCQAFPRPGEQRAWALRLPLGMDFESLPIDALAFSHNAECGRRLADEFRGGQTLFPPDVLSEISEEIKSAGSVPRKLLHRVLAAYGLATDFQERGPNLVERWFNDGLEIAIVDRDIISLSAAQFAIAQESVRALTERFTGSVRAVRRNSAS